MINHRIPKTIVCSVLLLLAMVAWCHAAGTTASGTPSLVEDVWTKEQRFIAVTITFTADVANAFATHVTGTGDTYSYAGLYLYKVIINGNHSGTEATENCDITITDDGAGSTADLLNSAGTDMVDNTADRELRTAINGTDSLQPIVGNLTINVDASSENAVASAVVYVTLIFLV